MRIGCAACTAPPYCGSTPPNSVQAVGLAHGGLDVEGLHVLPVLLKQGDQEVDGHLHKEGGRMLLPDSRPRYQTMPQSKLLGPQGMTKVRGLHPQSGEPACGTPQACMPCRERQTQGAVQYLDVDVQLALGHVDVAHSHTQAQHLLQLVLHGGADLHGLQRKGRSF